MPLELLVKHCAPTLAGMKIGNLVSHCFEDSAQFQAEIAQRNQQLNAKGIYFMVLKMGPTHALVYVYRKKQLQALLQTAEIQRFLAEKGYLLFTVECCLAVLKQHLTAQEFPHEIGVFLGYPLEDIKAFIQHKGAGCKVVGCWKSYTNEEDAKKTFAKYKKCTRIYCEKFAQGFDIARLAVSI